jgi:hypothetical protein
MQRLVLRLESSRPNRSRLGKGWGLIGLLVVLTSVGVHFMALGASRSPAILALMAKPEIVEPTVQWATARESIRGIDLDRLAPESKSMAVTLPSSFAPAPSAFDLLPASVEPELTGTLVALNFGL